MDEFAIKVSIIVEDGSGKPFGGTAWTNQGVLLSDALYVCHMALLSAGYSIDKLVAFIGDQEVSCD
jgi:hypothetical protein